jgi:hypothetical protein
MQAVKLNPKKLIHHFELAKSYVQVNQKKRAIKCMKKALTCQCEDINDQLGKLHCMEMLNKYTSKRRLGRLGQKVRLGQLGKKFRLRRKAALDDLIPLVDAEPDVEI